MNLLMASLSVQLLIYATAWLLMGQVFKVNRLAASFWAAAWYCAAGATGAVFYAGRAGVWTSDGMQNLLSITAFVLLQKGIDLYTSRTLRWLDAGVLLAGVLTIELLRTLGPDFLVLRVALLTGLASWPLGVAGWRMAHWLYVQRKAPWYLAVASVLPLALTILVFLARLSLISGGADANAVDFAQDSRFAAVSALVFLVMLGAFNFSLANLALGTLIDRLRELSATDQLTRLANRHTMLHRLSQEHDRYRRSGHGYAIVMLDLDYFKKVNDTHGHHVGDQVLRGVARTLQGCLRNTDTLARMGGEEFMLLMPMTDSDGAFTHARRLCNTLASTPLLTDAGQLSITVSLGVAEPLPSDADANATVIRADNALYQAKALGRNRVEVAPRSALPSGQ